MKCECRKEIEARLLARFIENNPGTENHRVSLKGYTLIFGDGTLKEAPFMPFVTSHLVTAPKTGNARERKQETNMLFNYCPFCGISLKDNTQTKAVP